VNWRDEVERSIAKKRSIPPDMPLPAASSSDSERTTIEVTNETTLHAARRLVERGLRPLALNFANGLHPGGGFLDGAKAQEEVLCRSSALFLTLVDDPMYEGHSHRARPDSTDWAILSPYVPVFRSDDGTELPQSWLVSFITCAAPVATRIGQPESGDLLKMRIHRVLSIARAYDYRSLILGAWGCGAFGNDIHRTASDFKSALTGEFAGAFSEVIFAITDWSPERRFLGPFRDAFEKNSQNATD
jgi:uncharacterized protein (TIGR02452 family)